MASHSVASLFGLGDLRATIVWDKPGAINSRLHLNLPAPSKHESPLSYTISTDRSTLEI
jgi:hypothetical protein